MQWTKEQDQLIRDFYDGRKQTRIKLIELTGHTDGAIRFRAGKFGLTTPRRHSVFDYGYFHNIDTEEKAYWLGFIFADGAVDDSRNRLRVSLVTEGKLHLQKLAKALNWSGSVLGPRTVKWKYKGVVKKSKVFTLELGEKNFIADLNKLGVVQAKTHIVKFPKIPDDLLRHFIRGVFDGDGSISRKTTVSKKQKVYITPSMNIVGAVPAFLEKIVEIYSIETGVKRAKVIKRKKSKSTWMFCYQGAPALRIRDWMYEGATIWMACKKDKFYSYNYSLSAPQDKELQESKIDQQMQNRGWQRLSGYEGWEGNLTIKCDQGHVWSTKAKNFKQGKGCPKCSNLKRGEQIRVWHAQRKNHEKV